MSYREVSSAPHMFNEFIDHGKSDLQNPFLNPQPVMPQPVFVAPPPHVGPIPTIRGIPREVATRLTTFRGTESNELTTFSKIRKYVWIATVVGLVVASRVALAKYSRQVELLKMRSPVFGEALEEVKDVQIPVAIGLASGPAIQLALNRDWPITTTIGIVGGLGYGAYKAGPHLLPLVSEAQKIAKPSFGLKRKKRKRNK